MNSHQRILDQFGGETKEHFSGSQNKFGISN